MYLDGGEAVEDVSETAKTTTPYSQFLCLVYLQCEVDALMLEEEASRGSHCGLEIPDVSTTLAVTTHILAFKLSIDLMTAVSPGL